MKRKSMSSFRNATALLLLCTFFSGGVLTADTDGGSKKPTGYATIGWGANEKEIRETLHFNDEFDCLDLHDVRHCMTSFDLGDYSVSTTLDLIDDHFGRVTMTFPASEFDLMRTTFVEKYGAPVSTKTVPIRTRMNVPYKNVVLRWKWTDVDAVLEKYGESVDRGSASITISDFRRGLKRLDERAKKHAKTAPF